MICQGKVIRLLPEKRLEIELAENSSCQSCRGCLTGAQDCATRSIIVSDNSQHQPGDTVELELNSAYYYKGFFLVFVLPLLSLITAMVILNFFKIDQTINLFVSLFIFLLAYIFAYRYDKKLARKDLYKILK